MTGCPLLDSEYAARQNGKKLPCERLEAENAKLRELVRDMWQDRDALSYGAAIPTLERMRELGVEVDDG